MNNKVLQHFLKIEQNSVNTNFREHGFQRVKTGRMNSKTLEMLSGIKLPDERNWKKQRQTIIVYSQNSDDAIAQQIDQYARPLFLARKFRNAAPEKDECVSNQDHDTSAPLDNTVPDKYSFLSLQSRTEIDTFLFRLDHDPAFGQRVLRLARDQWVMHLGENECVTTNTFLNSFFPLPGNPRALVLQTNCRFLLACCSHQGRVFRHLVSFVDFFRLFLRYGHPSGLWRTLDEITPQNELPNTPSFHHGFCCGFNLAIVTTLIPPGNWVIIEGDEAGTFTLVSQTIVSIRVDPTDEVHYLSVQRNVDSRVSARSWDEIFNLLQLTRGDAWPGPLSNPVPRSPRMPERAPDPCAFTPWEQFEASPFNDDLPETDS
jgi:hypothetical protein